jgi:hypothetical protein
LQHCGRLFEVRPALLVCLSVPPAVLPSCSSGFPAIIDPQTCPCILFTKPSHFRSVFYFFVSLSLSITSSVSFISGRRHSNRRRPHLCCYVQSSFSIHHRILESSSLASPAPEAQVYGTQASLVKSLHLLRTFYAPAPPPFLFASRQEKR